MSPTGAGPDEPTRVGSAAPYRPGRPVGGHEPTAVMPGAASPRPAAGPGGPGAGGAGGGGAGRGGSARYAEPRIHPRDLGRRGIITPFARLARGQAFSVMGEALFAIGLANTVFFSTDPNQSRWRVAGYLVLTFAPFLVAGPFIGPVLDRAKGGRKWVIFGAAIARAVLCLLLLRNLDDIYFYPEAFLMLVFSKINLISKSALVPTTVKNDEELVEANSKLTSLGALSAVAGAALAGVAVLVVKIPFLKLDDGNAKTVAILFLGCIAFLLTAVQAWNLPKAQVAADEAGAAERAELHSANIFLAASATGFSRATMGFLTFLLAFWVKNENHPIVWIGVLVGAAQVGYFLGSLLAPRVRKVVPEERMIQLSLGATSVAAFVTFFLRDVGSGLGGSAILAFTIGLTSNVLKQGFDSLVQRDAPDANRGRAFAKFETRFQLWWAVGALIPVILPIPLWMGIVMIAAISAFALGSYVFGLYEMTEVVAGRRQPRQKKPKPWSRQARRERRRAGDTEADPARAAGAAVAAAPGGAAEWAGTPPGAPHGPATVSPTDPTLADGLFGQPDVPLPETLYDIPEGGLFDPSAPPPPKGPGYHQPSSSEPPWVHDATGVADWASVPPPSGARPQWPETSAEPAAPNEMGARASGASEAAAPTEPSEFDIVELPDGTYGYRGAVAPDASPPGGPPPPGTIVEMPLPFTHAPEGAPPRPPAERAAWEHAEPRWRDEPAAGPPGEGTTDEGTTNERTTNERTTNEYPVVTPPPET